MTVMMRRPLHRPWRSLYGVRPSTIEPCSATALQMFRSTLQRCGPDAALVHYFDRSLSAGQLDAMSDSLAVALQQHGTEPGDRIAMYMQNIPQVVVAVLAAWKCGAVVVPCNPMLRQRELEKILNDSGSRVLICQDDLYADVARAALPDILRGMWLNVRLLAFCAVGAMLVGLATALLRTLRPAVFFPLRALATSYTYVFRGAPLIIVLYLLTFGVPGLRLSGTPTVLVLGGIALVITYGAYLAEVFRAGIESVHPSQRAAARSLGLTYRQTMRRVVLPQAVRRVAPPLLNDLVALQKDVGLISLAGPIDAIRAAQIQTAETYDFTPYVVAGGLFVLLAIPLIAVTDWVTLRAARRQSAELSA